MRVGLLRTVGAATAAYGAAVAAWPDLLARPSGLVDEDGRPAPDTGVALRPLGLRDAASGVALATAPEGAALRTAALVRIAADWGDSLLLGLTLPERDKRLKAVAVSVGWGALTAYGLLSGPAGKGGHGDRG
ncbi:hypothetical protein E4198_07045 [Streptomyces sp. RKND-216]|uniref:hypothetical protein n=1 Tax=Streptomyces sp. RKND-216 TaxID=2562581 RepID=UPI00109DE629|nr:hypothetical protein [Streptomyces sp. RKND-216]THA24534.1 hypothetical protein E4198_07045 [Streptomyces sp. RKND-216]